MPLSRRSREYRIVTPYARKRAHFTSRKEQGEIPVKWSDSIQSGSYTYSGGEAYGSQLKLLFATLADQEIAKSIIIIIIVILNNAWPKMSLTHL